MSKDRKAFLKLTKEEGRGYALQKYNSDWDMDFTGYSRNKTRIINSTWNKLGWNNPYEVIEVKFNDDTVDICRDSIIEETYNYNIEDLNKIFDMNDIIAVIELLRK